MTIPKYSELPSPQHVYKPGEPFESLDAALAITTTILGGAVRARTIDEIDGIRVPTIRGHLRFWWRAIMGPTFSKAKDLFAAETAVWGGVHGKTVTRSPVEICVRDVVHPPNSEDTSEIQLYGNRETPGSYALWPAKSQGNDISLVYPSASVEESRSRSRCPRVDFVWRLWVAHPAGHRQFDGDGGCRALASRCAHSRCVYESVRSRCFCEFATPIAGLSAVGGASLIAGKSNKDAMRVWVTALNWLKDFRQSPGNSNQDAREPGNGRPGRSRWPEPDKVRQLDRNPQRFSHQPRYNANPAWPRAALGLPIIGQFQKKGPKPKEPYTEPGDFQLQWREQRDGTTVDHDRLGSPLIVKAMPLRNGQFVPIALWLARTFPAGGQVVVHQNKRAVDRSVAPFDQLVGSGEQALFAPLNVPAGIPAGLRMRFAFMNWLQGAHDLQAIAPILPAEGKA